MVVGHACDGTERNGLLEDQRERAKEREREREKDRERDRLLQELAGDSDENPPKSSGPKEKTGIFSYIKKTAAAINGSSGSSNPVAGSGGRDDKDTTADGRAAGADGRARAAAARSARPNSAALVNILRSDRRTNIRMDREQFDGAQTRLRKLAPEGNDVRDNFRLVMSLRGVFVRARVSCVIRSGE